MNNLTRKLLKPADSILNYRIKRYCLGPNAIEIVGCRGVGKSTIYGLVAEEAKKAGKKVYCQYPYKGCYKIPVIESDLGEDVTVGYYRDRNGSDKPIKHHRPHKVYQVDKKWLYTTDFSDAVILLDEARTIYPARSYRDWTISDDEFFNFLRHLNVTVYLSSQEYAALDVNVHRAVDEVWFLWKKGNSSFTHVEVYSSMTVPVANMQKEVRLSFRKTMQPLDWEICYFMERKFKFFRPPYYDLFDTNFYYGDLKPSEAELWDDLYVKE